MKYVTCHYNKNYNKKIKKATNEGKQFCSRKQRMPLMGSNSRLSDDESDAVPIATHSPSVCGNQIAHDANQLQQQNKMIFSYKTRLWHCRCYALCPVTRLYNDSMKIKE